MGDYGFKHAGEFGGQDTNFNCLPDNVRHCKQCHYPTDVKNLTEGVCRTCQVTIVDTEQMIADKINPYVEDWKEKNS